MPPPPSYKCPDTRSLLFRNFLAAPLLNLQGTTERKFSGNETAGHNTDDEGAVIDAFAHGVVVDSQETIVLVDLQGMEPSFE
jgi:myosin-heavy-chain kinase